MFLWLNHNLHWRTRRASHLYTNFAHTILASLKKAFRVKFRAGISVVSNGRSTFEVSSPVTLDAVRAMLNFVDERRSFNFATQACYIPSERKDGPKPPQQRVENDKGCFRSHDLFVAASGARCMSCFNLIYHANMDRVWPTNTSRPSETLVVYGNHTAEPA